MVRFKTCAIVLALFCFHYGASCQNYTAINYSVSEGLPSNEAYEVFQDRNGFLWFATDNGVVKYDGYDMLRLGVEDGLTDPVVFGISEDAKGRIWFRTFSGKLCFYENGKIHPYRYNDKLIELIQQSVISSIYVDSLDQLWFGTFRHVGLYGRIDSTGQVYQHEPSGSIYYKETGEGNVFGYKQTPTETVEVNEDIYSIERVKPCDIYHLMPTKWRGKLFISACNYIFRIDGKKLETAFVAEAPIISLSVDFDENLWIGYATRGVQKFADETFREADNPQFLRKLSVSKVFQDDQKGLWFSTLEQGLFHVPNISIRNFTLANEAKIRVTATAPGRIFIGTNTGFILEPVGSGGIKTTGKFLAPVKGLYVDRYQHLWITNANSVDCIDLTTKKNIRPLQYSLTNATEDNNGNLYTVAGGALIVIIAPDRKTHKERRLPFMCRNVFAHDTSLFIVTRNGLYVSDLDIKRPRQIKSLSDYKINRFLKLNDSTLLLTSIGRGFIIFDSRTFEFRNFSTKNKFVANNIYSAAEHGEDLWLGTENGLVKLKKRSLSEEHLNFEVLTRHNGLISTQVTQVAFADGALWAFADNGFSLLNVNAFSQRHNPRFYLKNIRVNNRDVASFADLLDLPYDENNIAVSFGFISLDKQKIFIRHRLNKTEQWNYTLTKNLQFYSLAPGDYVIQTEYSLDNSTWRPAFQATLVISPPFWKTWYFLVSLVFSLALLTFLFFRHQMVVYRRHQQKLIVSEIQTIERERTRIAKDLHDSVGTDFSAIKMIVSQLLRKHQEPVADEIESQFQNSIQEIKSIIYGLAPPGLERYGLMTGLKNYTEKINGKVPARIKINTFGKEIKDPAVSVSVFRIIQELISNSLKHADAKNISIHINAFDDLLNIVYEDNGKGFNWSENQRGAGLYNIESRVQSIRGSLKFESNQYGVSYTIDIPIMKRERIS
jgi:signal transduction histidine kinase